MRITLLAAAALALAVTGCDAKKTAPESKPATPVVAAPFGDLSTSLAAARTAFNAHQGEARFLTLLSPT